MTVMTRITIRRHDGVAIFGVLLLVMIGLGALATFSFRSQALKTHRIRVEAEMRARYAAESAREYACDIVMKGETVTWHEFPLERCVGRLLIGDLDPADGSRIVLAYGEADGVGSLTLFTVKKDAPSLAGGPPVPGRLAVESLRDLSYTGASIPDRSLGPVERARLIQECLALRAHMNTQEILLRPTPDP